MIEAAMIRDESNNKSHWDPEIDPGWSLFADMLDCAAKAVKTEAPHLPTVLGGISPIDPAFIRMLDGKGPLDHVDVVAVHGVPLDWTLWQINEWPAKLPEIRAVTSRPVWVTEVGVSTCGAEEVQVFGLDRTAELLVGRAPRIHWYSLHDLPQALRATTRHREAEGSSCYRPPSTWGSCTMTGRRSRRSSMSPATRRRLACASGSTTRITASARRWSGCGGSG